MTRLELGFADTFIHLQKRVRPEGGLDTMTLADDLTAYWNGQRIRVGAGYSTDGASIPRIAWRLVGNPWEEYLAAAIVHDVLYETEHFERELADRCFVDLMEWLGVAAWRRGLMYRAVRIGGGPTWNKHTAQSIDIARHYLEVS